VQRGLEIPQDLRAKNVILLETRRITREGLGTQMILLAIEDLTSKQEKDAGC
jgi:hypothetical protein